MKSICGGGLQASTWPDHLLAVKWNSCGMGCDMDLDLLSNNSSFSTQEILGS